MNVNTVQGTVKGYYYLIKTPIFGVKFIYDSCDMIA